MRRFPLLIYISPSILVEKSDDFKLKLIHLIGIFHAGSKRCGKRPLSFLVALTAPTHILRPLTVKKSAVSATRNDNGLLAAHMTTTTRFHRATWLLSRKMWSCNGSRQWSMQINHGFFYQIQHHQFGTSTNFHYPQTLVRHKRILLHLHIFFWNLCKRSRQWSIQINHGFFY